MQVVASMHKGYVVALTTRLAISASIISLQYKLPMADSISLATASDCNATIWTQDIHFENIPGVSLF